MIEAMIWLQRNMMNVEAVAHENHVNPFKGKCKVALQVIDCKKTMQSSNHSNEDVCNAVGLLEAVCKMASFSSQLCQIRI